MRNRIRNSLLVVIVLLLSVQVSFAQTYAPIPKAVGYVNDFANVINSQAESQLAAIADSLAKEQGVEMAVVTISSIEPDDIDSYSIRLFDEWGIGGPEDSGLLILLVTGSREIKVTTGYGLEGVLPDGKVGAILDQFMIPHLARNDFSTGLLEGARAYRAELLGESFLLDHRSSGNEDSIGELAAFIIFVIIAVIVSRNSRRYPPTGGSGSGRTRRTQTPHIPGRMGGGRSGGGFGGFGGGRTGGGGAGRKF